MSADIYDLVLMLFVGWTGGVIFCIVIADLGVYLRQDRTDTRQEDQHE